MSTFFEIHFMERFKLRKWLKLGFSEHEAAKWKFRGFNLQQALQWKNCGFELLDACLMRADDLNPNEAKKRVIETIKSEKVFPF